MTLEFAVDKSIDTQVSIKNLVDDFAEIPAHPGEFIGESPAPPKEEGSSFEETESVSQGLESNREGGPELKRQTPKPTMYVPEWLSFEEKKGPKHLHRKTKM